MDIGIKYCGGCNPYYDRKKAFEKIQAAFPQHCYSFAAEDKCYDILLVICGCAACCPNCKNLHAKKVLFLNSQGAVDRLIQENSLNLATDF